MLVCPLHRVESTANSTSAALLLGRDIAIKRLVLSALLAALLVAAASCGANESDFRQRVVGNYADGAHTLYQRSADSARELDRAIQQFVTEPTSETYQEARRAWLAARNDYGLTEVYRFYDGPIDQDGLEMLINAWPVDEAYIDVVVGSAVPGLVQREDDLPELSPEALMELHQRGGEENVATGWHAIEFLLWGQDLSPDGPGDRPLEDFQSDRWAPRRRQYLTTVSGLLVEHLDSLVAAWEPGRADNYRATFVADSTERSLARILTGVGELARGELAGERMTVPYEERSQEEEHSCFSDNTIADLRANAAGIEAVLMGQYGTPDPGPGFFDLVARTNPEASAAARATLDAAIEAIRSIPGPFDRHLRPDVPDSDPGREAIFAAILKLEAFTEHLVAAAHEVGVTALEG